MTGQIEQVMMDFSYDVLDSETRVVVQQKTSEIRDHMRTSVQAIIAVGQRLIEVKDRLPHGEFGNWLHTEFQWDQDTAGNYMRVAIKYGDNPRAVEFAAASALYALAAPSTPQAARDEAQQLMDQGVKVTAAAAKEIVKRHKPAPAPRASSGTSATGHRPQITMTPITPAPTRSIGDIQVLTIPSIPPTVTVGDQEVPTAAFVGLEDSEEIAAAEPAPAAPTIDTKAFAYASAALEFARQLLRIATVRVEGLQEQIFAQGLEAIPYMDLEKVRRDAAAFIDGPAFKTQAGFIAMGVRVEVNSGEE